MRHLTWFIGILQSDYESFFQGINYTVYPIVCDMDFLPMRLDNYRDQLDYRHMDYAYPMFMQNGIHLLTGIPPVRRDINKIVCMI